MLPLKCRNISHTANYFSPNPQPYGYDYTPGACSLQSLPLRLTLESFPVGDRRQAYMHAHAHTHTSVNMHTCTCTYTHICAVCASEAQGNQESFYLGFLKWTFCSQPQSGPACAFKRDCYNHHQCLYYHHNLFIIMMLII